MTLTSNYITPGRYTISNAKQKSGCIGYLRNGAIMYEIEFTHDALSDLRNFKKFEQNIIFEAIQTPLVYEPLIETRNRFRREPPDIAAWELRIGVFRVFYNVE
jgi:mRNA-degrading endonuclease RelE of RelBE toxin-antitoxin system